MRKEIQIPTNCPSCDSKLELVNAQLFCRNILCPARASRGILHFAKTLKIKGLGEATIEKLNLEHFSGIYSLSEAEIVSKLGSEKVGKKLFSEIEKSKTAEFCSLIEAFGIPKVGKTLSSKLKSLSSVKQITADTCEKLGLKGVATNNLLEFFNTEFKDIEEFLPFPQLYNNQGIVDDTIEYTKDIICISGKLKSFKTKAEAKIVLEGLGYQVSDNLTKNVTILVDEENRGSEKRIKAEEMGLVIVDNLLNFIEKEKEI